MPRAIHTNEAEREGDIFTPWWTGTVEVRSGEGENLLHLNINFSYWVWACRYEQASESQERTSRITSAVVGHRSIRVLDTPPTLTPKFQGSCPVQVSIRVRCLTIDEFPGHSGYCRSTISPSTASIGQMEMMSRKQSRHEPCPISTRIRCLSSLVTSEWMLYWWGLPAWYSLRKTSSRRRSIALTYQSIISCSLEWPLYYFLLE